MEVQGTKVKFLLIRKCYKLHGYPFGFKFTKRPSFSPSSSVNYVTQNHGENSSETPQM
jgi:hypothetical protein